MTHPLNKIEVEKGQSLFSTEYGSAWLSLVLRQSDIGALVFESVVFTRSPDVVFLQKETI